MLGVGGIYAKGKNYGSKGYFMDFGGADQAEAKKKIAHLKKINWIDLFTKAVAVKWNVLNQLDGLFYSVTLLCETPGLDVRRCQYNIETVLFSERSFQASIDENGDIHVHSGISHNQTFPMLMLIGFMVLIYFVYAAKVALEMNLGFSALINTLECIHILLVEVALLCFLYSTIMKREFKIDLLDTETFVDLSLFNVLDKYCSIVLNMFLIFYPFRLFAFISRFSFSKMINGTLNTVVRMSPGLFSYFTIVFIISICISVSSMLLLGPTIPEMNSFEGAYFMTLTVNFFDLPAFKEMITTPNQTMFYPLIIFVYQQLMTFSMVTFIALSVYLFSKAIAQEKSIAVSNEDEEQADYLEEIHEKVCYIFSMTKNGADLLESGQGV